MAVIIPTKVDTLVDKVEQALSPVQLWKWEGITEADTCEPVKLEPFSDKSVQIAGTVDGISIEGSLVPDAGDDDYEILDEPNGDPITVSAGAIKSILPNVWFVRPKQPTGTGNDITVYLMAR